ncbi:hypothetical protein KQX64_17655 [Rhodopseudomonas palustris]|nr:hypothetical protein KQX64_17655 [Rhodopseudomonas palustris]
MDGFFEMQQLAAEITPDELMSPDVPEGYQTVAGWWATEEAAALDLLENPIGTLFEDEKEIVMKAEQRSILWKSCSAPAALQRVGFTHVKAFPLALLQQHYPSNP